MQVERSRSFRLYCRVSLLPYRLDAYSAVRDAISLSVSWVEATLPVICVGVFLPRVKAVAPLFSSPYMSCATFSCGDPTSPRSMERSIATYSSAAAASAFQNLRIQRLHRRYVEFVRARCLPPPPRGGMTGVQG